MMLTAWRTALVFNLTVENIPISVAESDLWVLKIAFLTQVHEAKTGQEMFSTIGHVRRVRYTPADQSAFITYDHISDARTAVTVFDNGLLHGQNIRVFLWDDPVRSVAKQKKNTSALCPQRAQNPFLLIATGVKRRHLGTRWKSIPPPINNPTGHPLYEYGFDPRHEPRHPTYGSTESKRPGYEAWLAGSPGGFISIPSKMISSSPFYSTERSEYKAFRGDEASDDPYGSDDYDEYWSLERKERKLLLLEKSCQDV
jgi:RNA recognition motif-containing protein